MICQRLTLRQACRSSWLFSCNDGEALRFCKVPLPMASRLPWARLETKEAPMAPSRSTTHSFCRQHVPYANLCIRPPLLIDHTICRSCTDADEHGWIRPSTGGNGPDLVRRRLSRNWRIQSFFQTAPCQIECCANLTCVELGKDSTQGHVTSSESVVEQGAARREST